MNLQGISRQSNLQLDLNWFFGEGACRFIRSSYGPMIEHAVLKQGGARKCPWCTDGIRWDWGLRVEKGGDGKPRPIWTDPKTGEDYTSNECPRCHGTGEIKTKIHRDMRARTGYRKCETCHGTGVFAGGESDAPYDSAHEISADTTCPDCGGRGYVEVPSVFQTHYEEPEGVLPDEESMRRAAVISRMLTAADSVFPMTSRVMEAIYCDEGQRWERRKLSLLALWHLTEAGARLLEGCGDDGRRSRLEAVLASSDAGIADLRRLANAQATRLHYEALRALKEVTR